MAYPSDVQHAATADWVPELDRLASVAMADWEVPGAALAVVKDGEVVLAKAYGLRDIEANLPVTTATQFLTCSITKTFTATAVGLLHIEGHLDWTKPVRDYLPEFRLHDPVASDRVTVHDLLSHQSGLPRHDWVHRPADRTPAELLGLMRHLELSRDIRSAYQYNNLCYSALGVLIERVSGQDYEAFIRARLTDRLAMSVSFSLEELEACAEPARPYMMHEGTRMPALRLPIRTMAAGAMNTSVMDLANWMRLHLAKGAFGGEQLVPARLFGGLHAPLVYEGQSGFAEFGAAHYGRGFQCNSYRGDRIVFHGGGWVGWGCRMTLLPDFGIGVAIFTNRSPSDLLGTLTWHIFDRLRGREPIDWHERFRKRWEQDKSQMQDDKAAKQTARHADTQPAHALAAYAGDYEHPAYGVMSVKEQGGALHWSWRGMFAAMTHRHFETFELPEVLDRLLPDGLPITFLTDRDGIIVSLSAPLEPMVKDIVFARLASGACTDAAFRKRCVGIYKNGATNHHVTLDASGQLFLKPDNQPLYRLAPEQGRRFRIAKLEGYAVEFRGEAANIDEMIFHQPNGTFIAKRTQN